MCLQWILFASRPLKVEELYYAVLSRTEPELITPWNSRILNEWTLRLFVINNSKGLAELSRANGVTVQFIHESVREYFLK
jgi:hypothetical protein